MSGGSFDYIYSRTDNFADELGLKIDQADEVNDWGEKPYKFEPATLAKLKEIEKLARYTAKLMKEAEWLYSGDTGDDSFMRRVAEIENRIPEEITMVKLSENRVALINLGTTIAALDELDTLIKFYSVDKPGPAYVTFTHVDGPGEVKTQIQRPVMVLALQAQRQHLVDYLAGLGVEA